MSEILIQCVVVLYKCSLDESKTLQSLAEFCRRQNSLAQQIALLIYDNSHRPEPTELDRWDCGSVEYRQALANDGLAVAYNYALSMARGAGIEWLLLLDQDTVLNPALFSVLFTTITPRLSSSVCAIVPKLMQEGVMLSPQMVGQFHNYDCSSEFSGIYEKQVTAFNSAACLRVQALVGIGGFPVEYWLDYLDHATFHRLQAAGGRVLILDVTMEHRLSLQSLEAEMDLDRYANVLAAEWRFVRETGTGGGTLIHRLRLLRRSLTHAIKLRNKAYASKTLRAALEGRWIRLGAMHQ
jgi:GT2 family glycosyltransferase